MSPPLLALAGLEVCYATRQGPLQAVAGVDLAIERGSSVALVGESGSGKSSLARAVVRLETPSAGRVELDGVDVRELDRRVLYARVQMVFQDPRGSLDPRWSLRRILGEMLALRRLPRAEQAPEMEEILREVGLGPELLDRYPHQLSGGQSQRVAIARALAVEPELLIADEPVSALDLSTRAHILELLVELRRRRQLTLLLVAHDLELVASFCDRLLVLHAGRLVEDLPARHLAEARHPYSRLLLDSLPPEHPDHRRERPAAAEPPGGDPPSARHRPAGCAFAPRCAHRSAHCLAEDPPLEPADHTSWRLACHHPMGE